MREPPFHPLPSEMTTEFLRDLAVVINRHSIDTLCSTPDFILAEHAAAALASLGKTTARRDRWWGFDATIGKGDGV